MTKRDWRELYASNRAAIARAGLAPPAEVLNLSDVAAVPNIRLGAAPGLDRLATVDKMGHGALVHVPRGLDRATPAPLVCMLHGCTQDPAGFAAATLMNDTANRHRFVVLYPGQAVADNPSRCWNWFLPGHQRRDEGEPAAIAGLVRDLIETGAQCTVDPTRVFVAGLSSGGAMAAILAACYPDLFAAAAVHSGLGYRAATSTASAFEVMARAGGDADAQGLAAYSAMGNHARPVPSIVIHGKADQTVAAANAINVLRTSMIANHLAAPDACDHDVTQPTSLWHGQAVGERPYTRSRWSDRSGVLMHELIEIDGLGHAWSGGATGHPHTDPQGPRAGDVIWTFFALATAGAAATPAD
jgi:poly(hydroxyalkanoate) depolymerase family esterase